jgi:hypothetical protein
MNVEAPGRPGTGRCLRCALAFGLAFPGLTFRASATDMCGDITTNSTWDFAGSPYVLTCSVNVLADATLTIDPGVVVESNDGHGIFVDGRLESTDAEFRLLYYRSEENRSRITARSGGEVALVGGLATGRGYISAESGGRVDLSGVAFSGSSAYPYRIQAEYFAGSDGSVDGTAGNWDLRLRSPGVTVTNGEVAYLRLHSSNWITNCTMNQLTLYDCAPSVTGCVLTGSQPLYIWDPDVDLSGVTGNTYTHGDPWINIWGTLDNPGTLGFVDSVLGQYVIVNPHVA